MCDIIAHQIFNFQVFRDHLKIFQPVFSIRDGSAVKVVSTLKCSAITSEAIPTMHPFETVS